MISQAKPLLQTFCCIAAVCLLAASLPACADQVVRRIEYKFENTTLVGHLIMDSTLTARRPAVLVADESNGPDARLRAAHIAQLGYVVFRVDLYGKDAPEKIDDPAALAGLNAPDRREVRGRMDAAMKTLLKQSGVNMKQIAAVGYGIGGTALIELARTGVDLEGVVCVHGPVLPGLPTDKAQVQPTFLILAGADDPQIPSDKLTSFAEEMKKQKVECTVARFKGVGHAFDEAANLKATEAIKLYLADEVPLKPVGNVAAKPGAAKGAVPDGVPAKVTEVLKYVEEHGEAMEGYEGGRTFGNYEHRLPAADKSGKRVKYREWDVNPHRAGVNRGTDRLITGSDDSAWYTDDHYETFKRVR